MWLNSTQLLFCDKNCFTVHKYNASWQSFILGCKQQITSMESITLDADSYVLFLQQSMDDNTLCRELCSSAINALFSHTYLVVPDHWVTQTRCKVDLVSSHKVHRLAGLALASEISHLAPERLHYCFHFAKNQELAVEVCSSLVLQRIEALFESDKKLKGVITASTCLRLLQRCQSFSQLSKELDKDTLSTYQQKTADPRQRGRRWIMLTGFVLSLQLALFVWHQTVSKVNMDTRERIRSIQQNTISLPTANQNAPYNIAVAALQTLPHSVRFNGFQSQQNDNNLSLTGSAATLNVLIQSWRERWPNFSFKLIKQLQRTRSVQDVVIEIKSVATVQNDSK